MFKKIKERLSETSTYLGLGGLIAGLGMLFKANGMPEAGQAIAQNAEQLASGDYVTPMALIIGGIIGALKSDK